MNMQTKVGVGVRLWFGWGSLRLNVNIQTKVGVGVRLRLGLGFIKIGLK